MAASAELAAFLRTKLSGVKIPRQIDFCAELPREPTGKLMKRGLRENYASPAADRSRGF
jgi:long-chain acyl-CoA synthetase